MIRAISILFSLLLPFIPITASANDEAQTVREAPSLYDVPLRWIDDRGESFNLGSLRGKPVILTLAYTNCASACPLTIGRLHSLAVTTEKEIPSTRFVIVSLDPTRDTPEELRRYRERNKFDTEHWHLLTGSADDLRTLAVLLNYSFRQDDGSKEIAHSNKIVALNRRGVVVAELDGLSSPTEPLLQALKQE